VIDPTLFAAYLAAIAVLVATPGPNMAYVAVRALAGGRRAGLAAVTGVSIASAVHTAAAVIGVSALIYQSAAGFALLKWGGAAYLIFLAFRLWRERGAVVAAPVPPASVRRVLVEGAVVNLLNPKVTLFFLAFLPQFVDPARGDASRQLAILGAAFAVADLLFLLVLIELTVRARRVLSVSEAVARLLRRAMALFFVAVAARLAFTARP
jgi:threonine/homoserine/homoserine lactone efflux protein